MKLWHWLVGGLAVVVLALGAAWLNRATVLAMVAHARLPHVAPNHPVLLWHVSHHVCVANSRALALAHVTRETPDRYRGVDGRIVREERHERAATA